ncbi:5475_t:CDS:1, partial [Entrophospora sp. SA101]
MTNDLSEKIFNFLTTSPLEHITAFSVIYQVMEEDPWIQQEILRNIVNNAVTLAINNYSRDISAQNKLYTIPVQ